MGGYAGWPPILASAVELPHGSGEQLGSHQAILIARWQRRFRSSFLVRRDIGSAQDCKAARRRIRAWLGTIAQRLFLTDLRRRTRRIRLVTGEDERVGSCESREELMRPLSPDEELVRLGMNEALNDKEREVLLSYASYYAPERKCQQPPDGEVPELCQRLGMTEENLRQTRKRAMTKLGDFILSQQSRLNERGYAHVRAQGQ